MESFGFNHEVHKIGDLLRLARQAGIYVGERETYSKKTRIWVLHYGWGQGVLKLRKIRQPFVTFQEALRSFDHTIDSIFEKAFLISGLQPQLEELRKLLRATGDSRKRKLQDAETLLTSLFVCLQRKSCGNLHELKERLGGEGLLKKSVHELVDDDNFGAAACTIALRLQPVSAEEVKRILEIIPRVRNRKRLLGLIWEHDLWYDPRFLNRLLRVLASAEKTKKQDLAPETLQAELVSFLSKFAAPYPWRLQEARNAMVYVLRKLERGELDTHAQAAWRRALTHVRKELTWLRLSGRNEQPHLFAGAA